MKCCSKRRYERIINIFLKVIEKERRVTDFQVRAQVEISSKLSKKHTLLSKQTQMRQLVQCSSDTLYCIYLACCAY